MGDAPGAAAALTTSTVSVVLPVHRQADHIAAVVERLHGATASISSAIEMILVVNGADDGSFDRCREAAGTLDGVSVVRVAESGWGRAVRAGLAHSTGQLLCFSNSARTSPEDLRTALALGLLNEGHAVKATRRSRDSIVRRSASVVYNLEARALFGLASWDINGTPKVFPRSFTPLLELQEPGDLLDLEWLVACRRHDLPLIEFPVTSVRRHGGVSTTKVRSAVGMYAGALRLRRRLSAQPAEPERG